MKNFLIALLISATFYVQPAVAQDSPSAVDVAADKILKNIEDIEKRSAPVNAQLQALNRELTGTDIANNHVSGSLKDQEAQANAYIKSINECSKQHKPNTGTGCKDEDLQRNITWLSNIRTRTGVVQEKIRTLQNQLEESDKAIADLRKNNDLIASKAQKVFNDQLESLNAMQKLEKMDIGVLDVKDATDRLELSSDQAVMGFYVRQKLEHLADNFCTAQKQCATDEDGGNKALLKGVFLKDYVLPKSSSASDAPKANQ